MSIKVNSKKLSRKQLREKYADEMCREVRYQITHNFEDVRPMYDILIKWMRVSRKTRYLRPTIKPI